MGKKEQLVAQIVKFTFVLITVGILIFFIIGEFIFPRETDECNTDYAEYNDGWYQVHEDGTTTQIEVPGVYDAGEQNVFIVKKQLGEEIDDDDWVCFRTAKQDVEIYVDDELRKTYSTEGIRPFGSFSVSLYVFVDLEDDDAGKTITYKAWSTDDSRAGVMRAVHYGDRFAIWLHLLMNGGLETMITLFMLFVALISVVIIGFVNVRYKKSLEIENLCWGVVLISIWLITQSDIRQLFFPNVSIANSMTYFTIMLAPVPFSIYIDGVQEHRYRKLHLIASAIALINFVFCTTLQVTGIRDLMDMSGLIFFGIGFTLVAMTITFVLDWKAGCLKEYRLVAIGFAGAIIAALSQMLSFYDLNRVSGGAAISIGVFFLLFMATIKSIMDILNLERQKKDAVIASEAKANFLARISHEIRTPINAVLGMDEMILRESTEKEIREYAVDIRSAGKTLLSLVNDVLDMSKIESGKMEIIESDYEPYRLIDNCYTLVAINAKEKGLEFNVINDETVPKMLYGDEVRIRQIIINLLTNAVKYTKKGSITFKVGFRELAGDNIMLSIMVSDTGIGISKESQTVLFDAFERFDDNNTRHIEGTGLGLNIVKQLVELMGGSIAVHSEYGSGSVFTVFIPQKVMSWENMGKYEPQQGDDYLPNYRQMFVAPRVNVLIVDDNALNIKVFKGLLKNTRMNIDSAESGMKCLEMVKDKKYDVIFLDHMMPNMDGVETLKNMKAMEENVNEDTPIIMLTANALSGAREEYVKCGFDDYITKPLKHTDLESMLFKYIPSHKILGNIRVLNSEVKAVSVPATDNSNVSVIEPKKQIIRPKKEENEEKIPIDIADLNFLDTKLGLAYCCNDENFYTEMVRLFVEGDKLSLLQEQYDADDWSNYRLQVHSLRSTALTIGAKELSRCAQDIEEAVKRKDHTYIHKNHSAMLKEYEEMIAKIKSVVEKK